VIASDVRCFGDFGHGVFRLKSGLKNERDDVLLALRIRTLCATRNPCGCDQPAINQ
jgi:hypothetical protein